MPCHVVKNCWENLHIHFAGCPWSILGIHNSEFGVLYLLIITKRSRVSCIRLNFYNGFKETQPADGNDEAWASWRLQGGFYACRWWVRFLFICIYYFLIMFLSLISSVCFIGCFKIQNENLFILFLQRLKRRHMKITFLQLANYMDWTLNLLVPQIFLRGIIFHMYLLHRGIGRLCKLTGCMFPRE